MMFSGTCSLVVHMFLYLPKGPWPDRLGGPRVLGRTGLGLAWGAKGPGPDRLGGPRVLGRTGLVLAWGAKGPGLDRLGYTYSSKQTIVKIQ